MNEVIYPSKIAGTANVPPSKSVSQRAFAASLICKGVTVLNGVGHSEDEKTALKIIQKLGAKVEILDKNRLKISSGFPFDEPDKIKLDCGESGLSLRMFAPIAALSRQEIEFTGKGTLLKRPLLFSEKLMNTLNVSVEVSFGRLPFKIKGHLQPKNIETDGSKSSQFLSGLLFAFSASGAHDVSIFVRDLKSRPYIDLTLSVMEAFSMDVPENRNYQAFYFSGQKKFSDEKSNREFDIEKDWSGAAFMLVAGAIAGEITVRELNILSRQADKKILEVLSECGAILNVSEKEICVKKSVLNSFYFDAAQCPDLIPPLVALAANCVGISIIKGASRLQYKESNRAINLQSEFGKLGLPIRIEGDEIIIEGKMLHGGIVDAHSDHRIAMACAVAALNASSPVIIKDATSVKKSYPHFFEELKSLYGKG